MQHTMDFEAKMEVIFTFDNMFASSEVGAIFSTKPVVYNHVDRDNGSFIYLFLNLHTMTG